MGDGKGVEMKNLGRLAHKQQSTQYQQLSNGQQLDVGTIDLLKNHSEMPDLHRRRFEHDTDVTRVEEAGIYDEQSQNLGTLGNELRDGDRLNLQQRTKSKRKDKKADKSVKSRKLNKSRDMGHIRRVSIDGSSVGKLPEDEDQDARYYDGDQQRDEQYYSSEGYDKVDGYRSALVDKQDESWMLGEKQLQQEWISTSEVKKRYGNSQDKKYNQEKLELRNAEEKKKHMENVIELLKS